MRRAMQIRRTYATGAITRKEAMLLLRLHGWAPAQASAFLKVADALAEEAREAASQVPAGVTAGRDELALA